MTSDRSNVSTDRSEFDDEEIRSLMSSEEEKTVPKDYRKRKLVLFLIVLLSSMLMAYREVFLKYNDSKVTKQSKKKGVYELKSLFMEERKNYDALLQERYGNYSNDFFMTSKILQQFVSPSSVSKDRLKLRMKIKIIQAALRPDHHENVTFTWAAGGHSGAAGHGNLLNQSYSAVLENVAQSHFAALGIEFRAKNHAMGGTYSGPEVAMCLNEIFGLDLDVLSWDYGMLDSRNVWMYEMYAQRAGVHPTMPSLFSMKSHASQNKHVNEYLESAGMAAFYVEADTKNFPDSDKVNVTELPPALQYMSCSGHNEAGQLCKAHKWKTSESCPDPVVRYQSTWHKGWKSHQYIGHLLAGYMVENLSDALNELDPSNMATEIIEQNLSNENRTNENDDTDESMAPSISHSYLKYLISLEERNKETFLASEVPTQFKELIDQKDTELNKIFHRSHSVCHTALLPSQARYDGLVTESGEVSTYLEGGRTTYVGEGYAWEDLPEPRGRDVPNPIWLTFNERSRKICKYAEIDFKDHFIVRQEDNWMSMLVPTNAEMEVFSPDHNHRSTLGVVVMCTSTFDWGNNPEGYVNIPDMVNSTSSGHNIVVNGIGVTAYASIQHNCYILEHEAGYYFPHSESGQYDIKIRVNAGQAYITSVVVL